MAKRCMIEKEKRRLILVKKYMARRAELRLIIKSANASQDEKREAQKKMQAYPKNSNRCRIRNRCSITGRPRGVYRRFGLGRTKLRELAMAGTIPGLRKASW
jgi:small subunit ribosomal protein S14